MWLRPWAWASVVVALPRLLVFPWNQNLYGDAIARTWLAHAWLERPHVIGSFDQGGLQFGPLHLYLLALAELAWPSLLHAGRVVSLLAGVASAVPLQALTRRLFGPQAAALAVFALGVWGLHIQCSTTSASEALNLLLVLTALERFAAWLDAPPGSARDGLWAALVLNLACATRYDAWLLVPLLALVAWRARGLRTALWFGAASSAFAVAWLHGNWVDRGDPLYPFRFIDDFHRAWYPQETARWGQWGYRLLCLFFWPGTAVLTLGPLLALPAMFGLGRAWKAGRARWLVLVVLVPVVLYTFRSVALSSFAMLGRFTVKEVALALPFAWLGLEPWLARLGPWRVRALRAGALACVGWTAALGLLTVDATRPWQVALMPVSPVVRIGGRHQQVADWVRAHLPPGSSLVVDEDPRGYDDLTLAYFSGVTFERVARRRSPRFQERLDQAPAAVVVRFEGGALEREGRLVLGPGAARFDGADFDEVAGFAAPFHVYRRR